MAELAPHLFQPGNQAAKKPRYIYDAMMREVIQNPAKLKEACASVLNQAANGDLDALDWIACRLEGKPAQSVTVAGDEDKPLISLVKMVVVQAASEHDQMRVVQDVPPVIEAQQAERLPDSQPATPMAEHVGEVSNSDTHLT